MRDSIPDLRVLVIADDPLARAGLSMILEGQAGCHVVGQAAAQADLLAEVDAARPDVVLWDLGWDPVAGLERLTELGEDLPITLALLPATDEESHAATAWSAGARGLLTRDADADKLLAALEAIIQGLIALDPVLAGKLLLAVQPPDALGEVLVEDLTSRELEVLQLMAEGLANKAIARQLGISDHTVKFHVNAILGKLGAQSRTEAVVRATRLGLIVL